MADARQDAKQALRHFKQIIQQLVALDAGAYADDPDQPMHEFNSIMNDATCGPIESSAQLQIVLGGLQYLLTAEADPLRGSLEDLMDSALSKAIAEVSSTRQWALLALARHRLRGHNIKLLYA